MFCIDISLQINHIPNNFHYNLNNNNDFRLTDHQTDQSNIKLGNRVLVKEKYEGEF